MLEDDIKKALDEVRGGLQADGGDLELVSIKDGVVKVKLTGAEVRALYAVAAHLVTSTANVADAEAVADIVIDAALSTAGPAAVLIAPAAEALAALVIEGIASGRIKPGAANEGQTHETPHSGRRP